MVPARKNLSEDFPLRQFVKCACCDRPLTANWSKSRDGTRHPYYLCRTRGCEAESKSIRKDDIESQFVTLLEGVTPSADLVSLADSMFRDLWDGELVSAKSQAATLKQTLNRVDMSIEQLLDRIVDTKNTTIIQTYENRISSLQSERIVLEEKIANCGRPTGDYDSNFRTTIEFISNPCKLWLSDSFEDKRAVLKLVFAEAPKYDRNLGFRTSVTACPFTILSQLCDQKSEVAHPIRFERTTSAFGGQRSIQLSYGCLGLSGRRGT